MAAIRTNMVMMADGGSGSKRVQSGGNSDIQAQLDAKAQEKSNYQSSIETFESQHTTLSSQQEQTQSQLDSANETLSLAETAVMAAEENVTNAQTAVSAAEAVVTEAKTNLMAANSAVAAARGALSAAYAIPAKVIEHEDGSVTYDTSARDAAVRSASAKLQAAEKQLQQAKIALSNAETELEKANNELKTAEKELQTAEKELQTAEKNVADLETKLSELETKISELDTQISDLESKIAAVEQEYNALLQKAEEEKRQQELQAQEEAKKEKEEEPQTVDDYMLSAIEAELQKQQSEIQTEADSKTGLGKLWDGAKGLFGGGTSGALDDVSEMYDVYNSLKDGSDTEAIAELYSKVFAEAPDIQAMQESIKTQESLKEGSFTLENGESVNLEDVAKQLSNQVDKLSNDFNDSVESQGIFSKAIGWINNNVVGLGTTEKMAQAQMEECQNLVNKLSSADTEQEFASIYKSLTGEDLTSDSLNELFAGTSKVDNTKASESAMDYKETQESAVNAVTTTVAGIATASMGPLGGMAVAAVINVGANAIDAATQANGKSIGQNLLDYAKGDMLKDGLVGGITGLSGGVANKVGSLASGAVLKSQVGTVVASKTGEMMLQTTASRVTGELVEGSLDGMIGNSLEYIVDCAFDEEKDFTLSEFGSQLGTGLVFGAGASVGLGEATGAIGKSFQKAADVNPDSKLLNLGTKIFGSSAVEVKAGDDITVRADVAVDKKGNSINQVVNNTTGKSTTFNGDGKVIVGDNKFVINNKTISLKDGNDLLSPNDIPFENSLDSALKTFDDKSVTYTAGRETADVTAKADAPKADASKADAPKTDVPKADAPKADAPNADAPNADVPKADAPKADAPNADVPNADVPNSEDVVPVFLAAESMSGVPTSSRTTDIEGAVAKFNEGSPVSNAVRRDVDLIALAKEQNISVNDLDVPSFKSVDDAIKNAPVGQVFQVEGSNKICIKLSDDSYIELDISKDAYNRLFPVFERYIAGQQVSGDCYLVSAIQTMFAHENPQVKAHLLSLFSEAADGSITVKMPKSGTEFTLANGQSITDIGLDGNKSIDGCLGLQMLEEAYKLDLINENVQVQLSQAVCDELNQSIAVLHELYDNGCNMGFSDYPSFFQNLKTKYADLKLDCSSVLDNPNLKPMEIAEIINNVNSLNSLPADIELLSRPHMDVLKTKYNLSDVQIESLKATVAAKEIQPNVLAAYSFNQSQDIEAIYQELLYAKAEDLAGHGGHSTNVFEAFGLNTQGENLGFLKTTEDISNLINDLKADPSKAENLVITAATTYTKGEIANPSPDNKAFFDYWRKNDPEYFQKMYENAPESLYPGLAQTHAYSFSMRQTDDGNFVFDVVNPHSLNSSYEKSLTLSESEFLSNFAHVYVAKAPEISSPDLGLPKVDVPNVAAKSVDVPKVGSSDFDAPKAGAASADVLKTEVPLVCKTSTSVLEANPELNKYKLDPNKVYMSENDFLNTLDRNEYSIRYDWSSYRNKVEKPHSAWKMHIYSDSITDYQNLQDVIVPYLKDNNISHKFLGKMSISQLNNSHQKGKAFTIYPSSVDEMAKVAKDLDYILRNNNLECPSARIIGDNNLGDTGRLHYRYEYKSGKYSDLVMNLNGQIDPKIKYKYGLDPQNKYNGDAYSIFDNYLYDANRGGNNYLASDMTIDDDIWRNFDPSNKNSVPGQKASNLKNNPQAEMPNVISPFEQSNSFNVKHNIGTDETIQNGYRDGGRAFSFDVNGNRVDKNGNPVPAGFGREIIVVDYSKDTKLQSYISDVKNATRGMNEAQKADYVHKYVRDLASQNGRLTPKICEDNSNLLPNGQEMLLSDIFGQGAAVCRHRSLMYKILGDEVGLKVELQRGNYFSDGLGSYGGGHAWNIVNYSNGDVAIHDVMHDTVSSITPGNFSSKANNYYTVDNKKLYGKGGVANFNSPKIELPKDAKQKFADKAGEVVAGLDGKFHAAKDKANEVVAGLDAKFNQVKENALNAFDDFNRVDLTNPDLKTNAAKAVIVSAAAVTAVKGLETIVNAAINSKNAETAEPNESTENHDEPVDNANPPADDNANPPADDNANPPADNNANPPADNTNPPAINPEVPTTNSSVPEATTPTDDETVAGIGKIDFSQDVNYAELLSFENLTFNTTQVYTNPIDTNLQNEILNPSVKGVSIVEQGDFVYRESETNKFESSNIGDEFMLNVTPSAKLIEALDRLMTKGEYDVNIGGSVVTLKLDDMTNFKYSTIKDASKWNQTDAPITIYFEGEVNEETLTALEIITAQFERGSFEEFFLNPWLKKLSNPNEQELMSLIKLLSSIDEELLNEFLVQCAAPVGLSGLQYEALKEIISQYKEYMLALI